MSALVDALTAQHRAVVVAAGQVNIALASEDRPRVAALLSTLRVGLLAHLELEDRELYPKMLAAAEAAGKADQALTARSFSDNMLRISADLKTFLARYSGDSLDLEALRAEWGGVLQTLRKRIEAEESVLYPMHDSLVASKSNR